MSNKTVEFDQHIAALRRQMRLERSASVRPPTVGARASDMTIHPTILVVAVEGKNESTDCILRVIQRDIDQGLADPEDLDKFWFVPGYSRVGGPDVVRP